MVTFAASSADPEGRERPTSCNKAVNDNELVKKEHKY